MPWVERSTAWSHDATRRRARRLPRNHETGVDAVADFAAAAPGAAHQPRSPRHRPRVARGLARGRRRRRPDPDGDTATWWRLPATSAPATKSTTDDLRVETRLLPPIPGWTAVGRRLSCGFDAGGASTTVAKCSPTSVCSASATRRVHRRAHAPIVPVHPAGQRTRSTRR